MSIWKSDFQRVRERQKDLSSTGSLPGGYKTPDLRHVKPKNFIQMSHMGERTPKARVPSFAAFPRSLARSWLGDGAAMAWQWTQSGVLVRCWRCKWQLYLLSHSTHPRIFFSHITYFSLTFWGSFISMNVTFFYQNKQYLILFSMKFLEVFSY